MFRCANMMLVVNCGHRCSLCKLYEPTVSIFYMPSTFKHSRPLKLTENITSSSFRAILFAPQQLMVKTNTFGIFASNVNIFIISVLTKQVIISQRRCSVCRYRYLCPDFQEAPSKTIGETGVLTNGLVGKLAIFM